MAGCQGKRRPGQRRGDCDGVSARGNPGSAQRCLAARLPRGCRAPQLFAGGLLPAGRRLATGAVLAALVLLAASVPASAQALTWSVVPSPSPGSGSGLAGVSCVSAAACTAVGRDTSSSGATHTLIESWNGTRWSVVPHPSPAGVSDVGLYGVSCVSAAACMAVGYGERGNGYYAFVLSWNGTRWSMAPFSQPGSSSVLYGVSCPPGSTCTAVGFYQKNTGSNAGTLVESWNGIQWSVVPSPSPGSEDNDLNGVSCVSAAACTAVGSYNLSTAMKSLVESWNGTTWSVVPSPSPGFNNPLTSVSCVSAAACTAVGEHGTSRFSKTLIESWNGTSWSQVPSPSPGSGHNTLASVQCLSAAACTAVGGSTNSGSGNPATLIESWNGTKWSVVPSPSPGPGSILEGVSCATAAACTAVGMKAGGTLIESGTARG